MQSAGPGAGGCMGVSVALSGGQGEREVSGRRAIARAMPEQTEKKWGGLQEPESHVEDRMG